jgi:quercetin dioxygenase-like cupin family protein
MHTTQRGSRCIARAPGHIIAVRRFWAAALADVTEEVMARRPLVLVRSAFVLLVLATAAALASFPALGAESATSVWTVAHGPVTTTLVTQGSDGHRLGDLRVVSIETTDADGTPSGRIDATLITTAIDVPNPGDEIRISELVFSFGDEADQIVIGGSARYPAAGSTIEIDSSTVRPILGGSGAYAGARGWVVTTHLADDSWTHEFHVLDGAGATPSASPAAGIVRTLLGDTQPATAPGQTLSLWHYTIPAESALTPHTHPGFQVARVVSGTLTYDVISGSVTVLRADGTTETAQSGAVLLVTAGDTVIENPELAHFGANAGDAPVEIVAASLFTSGSEPALPLPSPGG